MNKSGLKKAINMAGSQAELAALLKGASQQNISYWLRNGKVPAERVLAIEEVTGVARHELRPDLYPA